MDEPVKSNRQSFLGEGACPRLPFTSPGKKHICNKRPAAGHRKAVPLRFTTSFRGHDSLKTILSRNTQCENNGNEDT